jgi:hypothetical protein
VTYAPTTLVALGTFWAENDGIMLGVVGTQKHCAGYHLGKARIYSDCACKPDGTCEPGRRANDYSVTNARDKAGLTNAASAIDLGRLDGSLPKLYAFSRWLVNQCLGGVAGSRDVREIIYSPDGKRVQRFSGIDGNIHSGPGNGDQSHLMHTHISYFRDSEKRDKRPLFAPYFAPPEPEEPDVPGLGIKSTDSNARGIVTVKADAPHSIIRVRDGERIPVPAGQKRAVICKAALLAPLDKAAGDRTNGYLIAEIPTSPNVELAFVLASDVTFDPYDEDCRNAIGAQRERDRVAVLAKVEEVFAQ